MKCPVHPEEDLRVEWGSGTRTGFCVRCLKHHAVCPDIRYMASCDRPLNHEGRHRDVRGSEWTDDDPGHMRGRR